MPTRSPPVDHAGTARRSFWIAWAATVTFFAAFYALLTPLPRYLTAVGLPDEQVGLVLAAFGVAALLGRPAAGFATDRWGARPVMLAGAAALLVGALAVGATANVALLFGLRLLQAAGYAAFTTAGTGLVVLLAAPAERGQRLALFGAAANVAITLTPAAVSLLLATHPLTTGFLVSAGLALVAACLAWQLPARRAGAPRGGGTRLAFPRRLWASMTAASLLGVGFTAFFQFAPLLAARRGTLDVGWLYTSYGLGLILARVGAGGLVDRWGTGRMLVLTALLMAAGLALFAVAATPGRLLLASLLLAAAGLFHPTLLAHHAALLPTAPGQASAAFYVGFDLGIGLGSWLLGWALEAAGLAGLYGAACLAVLGVLPLIPVIARQRPTPTTSLADADKGLDPDA